MSDFSPMTLNLKFQPPELEENEAGCSHLICGYGSHWRVVTLAGHEEEASGQSSSVIPVLRNE